ncbi:hypothetical protein AGLY_017746 [Aphis glycines]|uniref:THAP domain-containing protein 9 n=1 Tax=Aphis glycines TaxID=307491 RepID=A0A6G0SV74_APHGL|nr:hypothetical protein AGLY_017746 [Aphis glycines]
MEFNIEECETPASEVLVFVLSSLKEKRKWPISYWFVDKIKSTVQEQLIKIAITECQKYKINVLSVSWNGAYVNSSTFNILGCKLSEEYSNIKPYFSIDQTKPNVYFTPDACHNIKLARNALGTFRAFKNENEQLIEWRYFEQLFELQNEAGFKLGNKIGSAHINWKGNSMKVKLAVQTLSSSVADALQYLKETSNDFKNCEPTIQFIRIIDEIFDFLNSRTPSGKDFKQLIHMENIIFKDNRMNSHIKYLYSLKTIDGVPLWKSQRKTFIIGFATSIKSIINISKDLLVNHGFKFVLTYKFSQDAIELFFGHMREDSLFSIKWKYKKPFMNQEDEEESTIKLFVDNVSNDPFIKTITDNVLYYISGYKVKKLIPVLQCPNYIKSLFNKSNYTNDHAYCQKNKEAFNNSISIKNRGGLQIASESVFKIVKLTE